MKINVPTTGVRLAETQILELWDKIENYEMPFYEDYLQYKFKWDPDYGWEAIVEYRKFIFLVLISDSEITPSENIDEVWHMHILHTRAYEEFGKLCGRFIHHGPGLPTEGKRWTRQYDVTFNLYRAVFNAEPPAAFWPATRMNVRVSTEPQPRIANVLKLFEKFDLNGAKVETLVP